MIINVTFGSIDEMKEFAARVAGEAAAPVQKRAEPVMEESVEEKPEETPEKNEGEDAEAETMDATGEEVTYTLVDVRAKLAELQKAGKRPQVQELIQSYGVMKLTQIPEDKYPDLMQKAGEL